jgi:hypothetical protein
MGEDKNARRGAEEFVPGKREDRGKARREHLGKAYDKVVPVYAKALCGRTRRWRCQEARHGWLGSEQSGPEFRLSRLKHMRFPVYAWEQRLS